MIETRSRGNNKLKCKNHIIKVNKEIKNNKYKHTKILKSTSNENSINYKSVNKFINNDENIIKFKSVKNNKFKSINIQNIKKSKSISKQYINASNIIKKFLIKHIFIIKLKKYANYILDEYLDPNKSYLSDKFKEKNINSSIAFINSNNNTIFYYYK